MRLSYPWIHFYKGKDSYSTDPTVLLTQGIGTSKIKQYYTSLFESGEHGKLLREHYSRRYYKRKRAGRFQRELDGMTMGGSIMTLFILCGGVAGLGIISFLESRKLFLTFLLGIRRALRKMSNQSFE